MVMEDENILRLELESTINCEQVENFEIKHIQRSN
jgi:hypothetical protein